MQKIFNALAIFAFLFCAQTNAEPIGYVKSVTGEASITNGTRSISAQPGAPIEAGDTVSTGAGASLGVTLKDNTMLSFGPLTRFAFEEFMFSPARGELALAGSIASGSLQYVSGVIAKLRPQAVKMKTPSCVIGVRGTRFAVVVPQ